MGTTPKTPKKSLHPLIIERIVAIRQNPPLNLGRIPSPKTIAYFLQTDSILLENGLTPPKSASTIWKVLVKQGCIARPGMVKHQPLEQLAPLECLAMDFKDASTVQITPEGKQQHVVEVLNFIDEGTSILWEAVSRPDFNAETVIQTLFEIFRERGIPKNLRFDRAARFVGATNGKEFPSALLRMLAVLEIGFHICPPHRPDQKPLSPTVTTALMGKSV